MHREAKSEVLARDSCEIAYETLRTKSTNAPADVVVLLHGFGMSRASMLDLGAQLLERGSAARALALDLRGHGATRCPADTAVYAYPPMCGDLLALLAAEAPAGAHLVGHSMGGQIGLLAAVSRPDLVRSLTTIAAGPCRAITLERERRTWERAATAFERASDDQLAAALAAAAPTELNWRPDLAPEVLYRGARGADLARIIRGGFFTLASNDSACRQLQIPTLVLAGEHDTSWLPASRRLAELVPRSQLEIVPGAGHLVHLERTAACADRIRTFIAGLD